jgi:hypothetical protein
VSCYAAILERIAGVGTYVTAKPFQ